MIEDISSRMCSSDQCYRGAHVKITENHGAPNLLAPNLLVRYACKEHVKPEKRETQGILFDEEGNNKKKTWYYR